MESKNPMQDWEWEWEGDTLFGKEDGYTVVIMDADFPSENEMHPECRDLISAAPDMLKALNELASRLGPRWFLEQNWAGPLDAIAKAEGRQP